MEVLLAAEHVTVTKATLADWEELQESLEDWTQELQELAGCRGRRDQQVL